MKSNAFGVGNVNLKGRITKRLRCGCCTAINLRSFYKKKQDTKYMREFRYEPRKESDS